MNSLIPTQEQMSKIPFHRSAQKLESRFQSYFNNPNEDAINKITKALWRCNKNYEEAFLSVTRSYGIGDPLPDWKINDLTMGILHIWHENKLPDVISNIAKVRLDFKDNDDIKSKLGFYEIKFEHMQTDPRYNSNFQYY